MFGRDNVQVELIDHDQPLDDARNDALLDLAGRVGVGVVAIEQRALRRPGRCRLATALAAVRARRSLDDMDGWLPATGDRAPALGRGDGGPARPLPRCAVDHAVELGRACAFDFRVVAPNLPDWPVPAGHTEASWLRHLAYEGRAGPVRAAGRRDHARCVRAD